MAQMLERRSASLASDAAIQRANTIVDANDPVLKLRLIDQVTAHLALAANPEGPQAVKAVEAELKDLLIRLSQDAAPTVRAWARYRVGQMSVDPAEKTASDMAADPVWYAACWAWQRRSEQLIRPGRSCWMPPRMIGMRRCAVLRCRSRPPWLRRVHRRSNRKAAGFPRVWAAGDRRDLGGAGGECLLRAR